MNLSRTLAMFIKEFVQLRRDRLTFATMIFIPVVQLLLFGYAIDTTPRHLPTAVLVHEENDLTRSVLAALSNTSYFSVTRIARSEAEMDHWMRSGSVLFGVEIPAGFERSVRRGDRPALLVAADASDPVAASTALGTLERVPRRAQLATMDLEESPHLERRGGRPYALEERERALRLARVEGVACEQRSPRRAEIGRQSLGLEPLQELTRLAQRARAAQHQRRLQLGLVAREASEQQTRPSEFAAQAQGARRRYRQTLGDGVEAFDMAQHLWIHR